MHRTNECVSSKQGRTKTSREPPTRIGSHTKKKHCDCSALFTFSRAMTSAFVVFLEELKKDVNIVHPSASVRFRGFSPLTQLRQLRNSSRPETSIASMVIPQAHRGERHPCRARKRIPSYFLLFVLRFARAILPPPPGRRTLSHCLRDANLCVDAACVPHLFHPSAS